MPDKISFTSSDFSSNGSDGSQSQRNCTYQESSTMCEVRQEPFGPFLSIVEEPIDKIRFRYKSETGSHGDLSRSDGLKTKKVHPTVQLGNFDMKVPVVIKASLYTDCDSPTEHVHQLSGRNCSNGECSISLKKDMTAQFSNIFIQTFPKKEIHELISQRRKHQKQDSLSKKEMNDLIKEMNKDCVRLGFQAFLQGHAKPLCPMVFSRPISDIKSLVAGDLTIVRLSKCSGRCTGDEEVFLLCEKVKKENIQVKFFEFEDNCSNKNVIWEAEGRFNRATDVHHQVAIVFQTPCYRKTDIDENVEVYMGLFRTSDKRTSELRKFTYYPNDEDSNIIDRKRKRQNDFVPGLSYSQNIQNENESSLMNSIRLTDETPFEKLQIPDELINSDYPHFNESIFDTFDNDVMIDGDPDSFQNEDNARPAREDNLTMNDDDMSDGVPIVDQMEGPTEKIQNKIYFDDFEIIGNHYYNGSVVENQSLRPPFYAESGSESSSENKIQYAILTSSTPWYCKIMDAIASTLFENRRSNGPSKWNLLKDIGGFVSHKVCDVSFGLIEMIQKKVAPKQPYNLGSKEMIQKEVAPKQPYKLGSKEIFQKEVAPEQPYKLGSKEMIQKEVAPKQPYKLGSKEMIQKEVAPEQPYDCLTAIINELGNNIFHLIISSQGDNGHFIEKLLDSSNAVQAINQPNFDFETPIQLAIRFYKPLILKQLLMKNDDFNKIYHHGNTLLHIAAENNSGACIRVIAQFRDKLPGKSLDPANDIGFSPLQVAVSKDKLDAVKALLECGSNVNFRRWYPPSTFDHLQTALHIAVQNRNYKLINLLLDQPKVDINIQNIKGKTAIAKGLIKNQPCSESSTDILTRDCNSSLLDSTKKTGFVLTKLMEEVENISITKVKSTALLSSKSGIPDGSQKTLHQAKTVIADAKKLNHQSDKVTDDAEALVGSDCEARLCSLLNPPNTGWKTLGTYLGWDKAYLNRIDVFTECPTSFLLTKFQRDGGSVGKLLSTLQLSGQECLTEAAAIIRKYNKVIRVKKENT